MYIEEIEENGATFQNLGPEFSFISPTSTADDPESVTFTWTDIDVDDDATISLYYEENQGAGGTLITSGISEDDDSDDSYTWNLSDVPYGIYYIYAVIEDNSNDPLVVYLDVPVMVGPLSIIVPDDLTAPSGSTFTVPIEVVNPLDLPKHSALGPLNDK